MRFLILLLLLFLYAFAAPWTGGLPPLVGALPVLQIVARQKTEEPFFLYSKHRDFDGVSLLTFSDRTGDPALVDIPRASLCANRQHLLVRRNVWAQYGRALNGYLTGLPPLEAWCRKMSNYATPSACSEAYLISPDLRGRVASNETYYVTVRSSPVAYSLGLSGALRSSVSPPGVSRWWTVPVPANATATAEGAEPPEAEDGETPVRLFVLDPETSTYWMRLDASDDNELALHALTDLRVRRPTVWFKGGYVAICGGDREAAKAEGEAAGAARRRRL
jgi:hypothetical protein